MRPAARVLMLVPEIALTPAVAALFRAGVRRARGHPAQRPVRRRAARPVAAHPPRRHRRRGRHALGGVRAARPDRPRSSSTRSTTPRTSRKRARATTAATWRSCAAQRAGALVVLGSATPSMETLLTTRWPASTSASSSNAACSTGRWRRSRVVDMREEYAAERPGRGPEPRARRRRSRPGSSAREQSLVLLNRRGFATAVFCRQCAGTLDCPNCSVSLVVHGEGLARGARALPLLQLLDARAAGVPALRRAVSRAGRLRHRARRGRSRARSVRARASRASTATRSAAKARSSTLLDQVPRRRDRRAGRHADDRQGPRLSARHAGRRRSRRTSASGSPISARPSGRFSC